LLQSDSTISDVLLVNVSQVSKSVKSSQKQYDMNNSIC